MRVKIPMLIIQSLSRIDSFLLQHAPVQLAQFGNGLTEEQINHLTKDMPCPLLGELHELYKWHNGSGYNLICHGYYLEPLEDTMKVMKILYNMPNFWESDFFRFAVDNKQDFLLVDCHKHNSPVWYRSSEDPTTEIFWSSITKMMKTIAEACEMGAYCFDNDYFVSDNRKFLEVMWRNDPDIINSIVEQLEIAKEDRLTHISSSRYESISRFVWQDISELFDKIRSTRDDAVSVEILQEFSSIFVDECKRIMNRETER
jgi:hypothetical protein